MSDVIVVKFGGSSLADGGQFRKVKSIINVNEGRKYIVPSAPGKRNKEDYKITDLLYKCHSLAKDGSGFDEVFEIIHNRYVEIVRDLSIEVDIESHLEKVKSKITSGESADYTASRGEYLNGVILAKYLDAEFVDAAEVIYFDNLGNLDVEYTQSAMSKRLSNIERAVIPGFYGSTPDGRIKTFSRGGSDITGAIVARGVGADLYENWTDVSGFLMADPRVVENPKTIKKITYKELRELSYMGATVLHDESVFPVRKAGIPINIKNTNAPEDEGTYIVNEKESTDVSDVITGIAGKKGFTSINIEKTMMNGNTVFMKNLLIILDENKIPIEHMPIGIDTVSLVVPDSKLEGKLDKVIEEIKEKCMPDAVEVMPGMALIAAVGLGLADKKDTSAKVLSALGDAGINVRMVDLGSSKINIIAGVDNEDLDKAVREVYKAFVN